MDPCTRECYLAIGILNPEQVTKSKIDAKLKHIYQRLAQIDKRLDKALSHPRAVDIQIADMEVDSKEEPEPSSIEEIIKKTKTGFNEKIRSVSPHLQLNEKKKQVTQIRKNYYTWYLDYINTTIIHTCGNHKFHRKDFISGVRPTYTHDELRTVCEKLMQMRHNKVADPSLTSDIVFLTETRDRKIRQDILKLFVTYQNYLDLYTAYYDTPNPDILKLCKKRIIDAQLMQTIQDLMLCSLQYYMKKFEKKFGYSTEI